MKKRLTIAALALLTTTAQAQLLLPPAPLTQWQTEMLNMATVGFYIFDCKKMMHLDYAYGREKVWRGLGRASVSDNRDAREIIKAKIEAMGRDKFCAAADRDTEVQATVERIKTRDGR